MLWEEPYSAVIFTSNYIENLELVAHREKDTFLILSSPSCMFGENGKWLRDSWHDLKRYVYKSSVYWSECFVWNLLLQILDTNPQLFFHLQQQRLIELIRNGKIEEALEFAQEELAPRGEENVNFFCLANFASPRLFILLRSLYCVILIPYPET